MLANLRALFGVFVDILLLRRGPEHLPASPLLLGSVLGLYIAVSAAVAMAMSGMDRAWPVVLILGVVTLSGWYFVALALARKRERFAQTLTAMYGVITIFTPLVVPMMNIAAQQAQADEPVSQSFALLLLLMVVWAVVVLVRIVSSAFEVRWPAALLLVIGQEIFTILVFVLILGGAAKST